MTWLGSVDHHSGWFKPPDSTMEAAGSCPRLMSRGSLVVEAQLSPEQRPQTLLAFDRHYPWPGSFSLRAIPGCSLVLVEAQGGDPQSAILPCPYQERTSLVRVTYSWNAPDRSGWLAIERPEPDSSHIVPLEHARPMVLGDLREVLQEPRLREMDHNVMHLAVSDQVEPIGPTPSLTGETRVMTHLGEKPIRDIRRGDVVRTAAGTLVPVLQVVRRVVPARGGFQPIRLRAGYFGLSRDVVVAPDQRIIKQGSDVEYTFGCEAVSVPARHLLNTKGAVLARGPRTVAYYQLILPGHEVIMASGCAMESLYIGRLRRKPEKLSRSILSSVDRSLLPEHANPVWPVLKPFEAIMLASIRAA